MFTFNLCILKRIRQLLRTLVVFAGFLRLVLGSLCWLERCHWWTGSISNQITKVSHISSLLICVLLSFLLAVPTIPKSRKPFMQAQYVRSLYWKHMSYSHIVLIHCKYTIIYDYIYLCVHVTEMDIYIVHHSIIIVLCYTVSYDAMLILCCILPCRFRLCILYHILLFILPAIFFIVHFSLNFTAA